MATSGSTDFSVSRNDIILRALRIINVIDPDTSESVLSTPITNAALSLNSIVKNLINDGLHLWAIYQDSFSLTEDQASYAISSVATTHPTKIISAFVRDSSTNNDIPIRIISRQEYWDSGSKTSTGIPNQLYYDNQLTDALAKIYLYPTPNSYSETNCSVYINYHRPFEDFDTSSDTPDFPQEWYETLTYLLAASLAYEYGRDLQYIALLEKKADSLKQIALNYNREEAPVFMQPDARYTYAR